MLSQECICVLCIWIAIRGLIDYFVFPNFNSLNIPTLKAIFEK